MPSSSCQIDCPMENPNMGVELSTASISASFPFKERVVYGIICN